MIKKGDSSPLVKIIYSTYYEDLTNNMLQSIEATFESNNTCLLYTSDAADE